MQAGVAGAPGVFGTVFRRQVSRPGGAGAGAEVDPPFPDASRSRDEVEVCSLVACSESQRVALTEVCQ